MKERPAEIVAAREAVRALANLPQPWSPHNLARRRLGRAVLPGITTVRMGLSTAYQAGLELTSASQRVLTAAAEAARPGSGWSFPELLLALLREGECRAAAMLRERGITESVLCERWTQLPPAAEFGDDEKTAPRANRGANSTEVDRALRAAARRFQGISPPLPLATEHLLLAILESDSDAAEFLSARGLVAQAIVDGTWQQYEVSHEPLVLNELTEASPAEGTSPGGEPRQDSHPAVSAAAPDDAVAPDDAAEAGGPSPGNLPLVVWRILDAAANRAREAYRVLEDYARFALDDRHLTQRLKESRHRLAAALARFPQRNLQAGRDTAADVGTSLSTPGEESRGDLAAVMVANGKRLQESLRSLEEYAKLADSECARTFKALRYESYTLERALHAATRSLQKLRHARLYVLLDARRSEEEFTRVARGLVAAGAGVIQLRDKQVDDRTLLARARRLRRLTQDSDTLFIMNDRPDLAVLADADGVHVGQEELPVAEARKIVGPDRLVGLSTHSLEQARAAVLAGADYIGVGPTFPSQTKQFDAFPGLELVRAVADEIALPAFVIGGVTLENLPQVLAQGGRRVAVAGAIVQARQPEEAARQFLAQLRGNHG